MNKLYFGNGECSVEGNVYAIQINFSGAVEIESTHPDAYTLFAGPNKIIIVGVSMATKDNEPLSDLFKYQGEFKINSVITVDSQGLKSPCSIKPILDYSELMFSNSEDMTMLSEEMGVGYVNNKHITKTVVKDAIIKNLHTKNSTLYLKDGTQYQGRFHIHKSNGKAMTGADHSESSKDLYYKKINIKGETVEKLISIGTEKSIIKGKKTSTTRRTVRSTPSRSTGGY